MHFTWKSKQNAAVQPSLLYRNPPTCSETSTVCRIVFSCFAPSAEKTNSFSQFQPTGIRLSTSVFVKLKGLYSQWRAARRNFPLLVFPLVSLTATLPQNKVGWIMDTPQTSVVYKSELTRRARTSIKYRFTPGTRLRKRNAGMETGCAAPLWNVVNAAEKQ